MTFPLNVLMVRYMSFHQGRNLVSSRRQDIKKALQLQRFEVQRHILPINVAASLAFGAVFRDFRLLCFGSHEKCTQSVLTKWTILYLFVVLQISTLMSRTPTPRLP